MKNKWLKIGAPIIVLVLSIVGMKAMIDAGPKPPEKKEIDTRPIVTVQKANPEFHQVQLQSHGEVIPLEKTMITAQVSGEVIAWNQNFVEGGLVKRGEVLFEIEKDSYEAAYLLAEANLKTAQARLVEEQGRAEVAQREAKSLPDVRVTDLYLRKPQVMSAEASVKSAEAALKIAKRDLDNCIVRAPYDALIVRRDIGKGQFVNRGAAVGELFNIEKAEVKFPIAGFDRSFLPNNLRGLPAQISTKEKFGSSRTGTIVRDSGVIDQKTRMGHIIVQIDDPYGVKQDLPKLPFGTYVEVTFNGQGLNNIIKLSQDLVTNNRVWVLGDEQKLVSKQVDVVREEGKTFLIGGGLSESDMIVTTIPEYAQNGMAVKLDTDVEKANDKKEDEGEVTAKPESDATPAATEKEAD